MKHMSSTGSKNAAKSAVLAMTLAAMTGLSACGLSSGSAVPLQVSPGSIQPVESLSGVEISVGGKDFTEGVLLTYVVEFALDAAGMKVNDLAALAGSLSFRQAMISGQVDIGVDYTGTGWIAYLGNEEPLSDAKEQWEAVRDQDLAENGIVWLPPSEVDNTYALAMSPRTAERTGVTTLSDYAELVKTDPQSASTCLETEFRARQDGFPGMARTYGFSLERVPISIMQSGIIYQSTASENDCNFGEVYTTDGRVKGLGLTIVEDDKNFFPSYNAAVVARNEMVDRNPAIKDVLAPVMQALDNEVVVELNRRVDVAGEDPAEVARSWMVDVGFVKLPG